MDYSSCLAVRDGQGGGNESFGNESFGNEGFLRRALLTHLLHPSVCPGLFETSCFEPLPNRALGLGFSIYLPACESSSYNIKYMREDKEIGHGEYTLRQGGKKHRVRTTSVAVGSITLL